MPEFAPPSAAQKAGPPKPTQTKNPVKTAQVDPLGVRMIYPSNPGGQAWFINMNNPESDKRFDPKDTITRNPDGSWKIRDTQVRMNVFTTSGYKPSTIITNQKQLASRGYMQDPNDWRNVEVTGYVRVNAAGDDDNFTWYARGGKHGKDGACVGTAYKPGLFFSGKIQFSKEQWHSKGYAKSDEISALPSIKGRWVGFKSVVYNTSVGVQLEIWLDNASNNQWKRYATFLDRGGWGNEAGKCGGSPDQIIWWGGPVVTYRWDSATDVDFAYLSVREITPPKK
jgi:hypothetical protein